MKGWIMIGIAAGALALFLAAVTTRSSPPGLNRQKSPGALDASILDAPAVVPSARKPPTRVVTRLDEPSRLSPQDEYARDLVLHLRMAGLNRDEVARKSMIEALKASKGNVRAILEGELAMATNPEVRGTLQDALKELR